MRIRFGTAASSNLQVYLLPVLIYRVHCRYIILNNIKLGKEKLLILFHGSSNFVQGLHALFTGEDDTWEAWLVFDKSGFKLGGGNTIKLRRGFSSSGSLKPTQVSVL